MRAVKYVINVNGNEYVPSPINGRDVTTWDFLENVTGAVADNSLDGFSFWKDGCCFVAEDPERHDNTHNAGWIRCVYRKVDCNLDKALKAISDAIHAECDGYDDLHCKVDIVGCDIRYSFWRPAPQPKW